MGVEKGRFHFQNCKMNCVFSFYR